LNIVIIGGGGHGRVVIDIVEKSARFTLLGFLDARLSPGDTVQGYTVLGSDTELNRWIDEKQIEGVVIAIGDNWQRSKAAEAIRALAPGVAFPNAIHPAAQIARGVRMGHGNVVMAGATINSNTAIGNFCIFNTNCSVDHDSVVADYVSFAPNSCAGGSVRVGTCTAVCLGANVVDRVEIGEHTVIGAGATVLHDQPPRVVAFGTPARKVQDRCIGDKYL
jgi:sugar O-acyltransferase (sialic acid O-acetyltransferase NeuD family)